MKPEIVPYRHLQYAETLITENEALTKTPYKDQAGKLTIGYGRNLEERGIRYNEAELMLANDIEEAHIELKGIDFYSELSDVRKAVLIDMAYNLGFVGLLKFKNMMEALRIKDYDKAAYEIENSKYWNQVGIRAKRNWYQMKFDVIATRQTVRSYFTNI